jgi:D-serine deaminase-like pyridoxal phosphate-dependent protein
VACYDATVLDELDTPAVLVDLERLDANIGRMAAIAREAGVALRPHAKSHKLPQVGARQLEAGSVGLTVAKLGEAEVFVDHGVTDLLVAYPLWGDAKWRRLCELSTRARITVAADSHEVVDGLSAVAAAHGHEMPVLVEIDCGFERCGVAGPQAALALARRIVEAPGLSFAGIMSFAGQSYAAGTDAEIDAIARHDADALGDAASVIRGAGIDVGVVSAGGTPTARRMAAMRGITEIRPGAYALSDRDQVALGWGTLDDCALSVLTTVVSRPTATRAVIDAGSKTLSSDGAFQDGCWGVVVGRPELRVVRLTEEHGILELSGSDHLPIGTQLRIIPNHCCGTINMHDEVIALRDGEVAEAWSVAARAKVQ